MIKMDKESLILEMRKSFYFRNYTTWFDFRKFYNMVWDSLDQASPYMA